jgi:hypothetical protein
MDTMSEGLPTDIIIGVIPTSIPMPPWPSRGSAPVSGN